MSSASEVARRLADQQRIRVLTAQFVDTNSDGTVQVDFGQGSLTIYSAGLYMPSPGEYVRTLQVDTLTIMLGPVTPKPAYGRVTATGSPKLTVLLPTGSTVSLPRVSSAYPSPSVNDDVLISWADGGMVIGKVTEVPLSDYLPPPPAGGGGGVRTVEFRATDSGSYQGSWWTGEVWASDNNLGAWFYGTVIADTIPDAAAIVSVEIYVNEFYGYGYPPIFGLHSLASKSGAPSIGSTLEIPAGSGWRTLPNAFGDALKTGASLGVGVAHGGFHKYTARSQDAQSGLLRITYAT